MYFDPVAFGKRLREARVIRGMSQEEFASRLNIGRIHLAKIETGVRGCSLDLLVEIAFCLNVSTDYLLLGKKIPANDDHRQKILDVIGELTQIARDL